MTYTITLDQPSRSKCPNAWACLPGQIGTWLRDGDEVTDAIIVGGTLRRATRQQKITETITITGPGTYRAWDGFGTITVEEAA